MSSSNCVTWSSSASVWLTRSAAHAARSIAAAKACAETSRSADLDPLGVGDEVREKVGARAQPVALEDRRDHARRRGLAVGADDVDRAKAPLRRVEHGHHAPHPVEAEAHPEQLERAQVPLGALAVQGAPPLTAPPVRRAARELRALALDDLRRGRVRARSPRSRACPRRGRSRLSSFARAAARRRSAASRVEALGGEHLDRAARHRDRGHRGAPRPRRRHQPSPRSSRASRARIAVVHSYPSAHRRARTIAPGARSRASRQPRTSVIASIDARQLDLRVARRSATGPRTGRGSPRAARLAAEVTTTAPR